MTSIDIIDARRLRRGRRIEASGRPRMAVGIVFIIVGSLLLLDSLNVIPQVTAAQFWAAALIGFGLTIVLRAALRSWRRR